MTSKVEAKVRHQIASDRYHPVRQRRRALEIWCIQGRIQISDAGNDYIGVLLGTLNFWDKRGDFPSEKLFAQVALAVEAGQGNPGYDMGPWTGGIEDYKPSGVIKLDRIT